MRVLFLCLFLYALKKFFSIFSHIGYDIWTTFCVFSVKKSQRLLTRRVSFSLLYLFRRNFHQKIVYFSLFTNLPFWCIIQKLSAAPTPQPRTTVFITLRNINLMISSAHGIDPRLCFYFFMVSLCWSMVLFFATFFRRKSPKELPAKEFLWEHQGWFMRIKFYNK